MNKFDLQFLACATNCCEVYLCVCVCCQFWRAIQWKLSLACGEVHLELATVVNDLSNNKCVLTVQITMWGQCPVREFNSIWLNF